jgi:asparagine synthase (glutamine-hydrolysing)
MLPEVARIFDEPLADATIIPAVLLSRLARSQVTMVLSGDGGDELFCGYPTQTAHRAAEVFRRFPSRLRRMVAAAAERLHVSDRYLSFDFALRRFVRDAARPAPERHLRWMGSFSPEALPCVFSEEARRQVEGIDPYDDARQALRLMRPRSSSDVATALDLLFYLAEDNLVQADRASMSTSLEVRAPFLDRRLAEYALGLPTEVRRGLWQTKPLLRQAARPLLARGVRMRAKHGFGVPTSSWLRGELRPLVNDLLSPARLCRQGIFSPTYVGTLVKQHLAGVANHRKELWTLLVFQLWASQYLGA